MKIVVVDDNVDFLIIVHNFLTSSGHKVEVAQSKAQALELLERFTPHLILLDIRVGPEDGRQLCLDIKTNPTTENIKVILTTGYELQKKDVIQYKADDIISKPFSMNSLFSKIDYVFSA